MPYLVHKLLQQSRADGIWVLLCKELKHGVSIEIILNDRLDFGVLSLSRLWKTAVCEEIFGPVTQHLGLLAGGGTFVKEQRADLSRSGNFGSLPSFACIL